MVEMSDLDKKIVKQVEHYFHDINLCRDHFLKSVICENDGWVDMDTMLKFKRLAALCDDKEKIFNALKENSSELLEVSEQGIRRKPDLKVPENPSEVNAKYEGQCLYIKGFPQDALLDDIIEFIEQHGGPTINVNMRRFPQQGTFKGSVFATFKTKEDSDKFLKSEGGAKYKDNELIRKWQVDYFQEKRSERESKADKRSKNNAAAQADRDAHLVSRMTAGALLELSGLPPADHKSDDKTSNEVNDEKQEKETEATDTTTATAGSKRKAEDQNSVPRSGLHVVELKTWLADKLGDKISIAWVDVFPREARAIVRFKEENSASAAWNILSTGAEKTNDAKGDSSEATEGGNEIDCIYAGHKLSGRILSGDEEKECWRSIFAAISRKNSNKNRNFGGGGGGGKFGNKKRRTH